MWWLLLVLVVGIPYLAAAQVDANIDKFLKQRRARLAKLGRVYAQKRRRRRKPYILLTLITLFLWAFLSLAVEGADQQLVNIIMLLLLVGIGSLAALAILPTISLVALGENALYVSWLGRVKQLRYDQIYFVDEYSWLPMPHIRIGNKTTTVYINRAVERLGELYATIAERSDAFRTLPQSAPLNWRLTRRFWWTHGVTLAAVYLLLIASLFTRLSEQDALNSQGEWGFFAIVTFILFFATLFVFMLWGTGLSGNRPDALLFANDTLHYRIIFNGWRIVPRSAIQEVKQTSTGQAVHSNSLLTVPNRDKLIIRFTNGTKLEVDEQRALQFGTTVYTMFAQIETHLHQ